MPTPSSPTSRARPAAAFAAGPGDSPVATAAQERARVALRREMTFVDSSRFRDADFVCRMNELAESLPGSVDRHASASFTGLNQTVRICANGVSRLLSNDEERDFFFCLNFLKRRANALRSTIDSISPQVSLLEEFESLQRQVLVVRNRLFNANVRLVMSIAKTYCERSVTFDELFSEGGPVLLRVIDKFDVERGFRFSTYAYPAISRRMRKFKIEAFKRRHREVSSVDATVLDSRESGAAVRNGLPPAVVPLVRELLDGLPPRDSRIVQARFGLVDGSSRTLEEIGRLHGVSKERTRQLLARAMASLRAVVEQPRFSALTEFNDDSLAT